MKWYLLAIALIISGSTDVAAQPDSYKLEVTYNKTTNVIFPSSITSVDRGSQEVLVQKAAGAENILRVKAGVKDFTETSLSVITADSKLYSFILSYTHQPAYLVIDVGKINRSDTASVIYAETPENKKDYNSYADSVIKRGKNRRAIRTKNSKVSVALEALYIHNDLLFCNFFLKNTSSINYDIDQVHFYIRDKKESKRTASQEIKVNPSFISGDTTVIKNDAQISWVVALPKFTIPDGKFLSVEIIEKNGGRNLILKVRNRDIMKAEVL